MGENSPFGKKKNPFATLTELADPFHLDPVGRTLHETVAQGMGPQKDPLEDAINKEGYPDDHIITQPTQSQVTDVAINSERDDLRRRRGGSTLLTSGQGLSDQPSTASAVLLGS